MACTSLTKGRGLTCDRIAGGIKNVYFGVYDDFGANATTGEILGTGIVISAGSVTDIEMAGNDLYRYALPRGESSLTETIVGSAVVASLGKAVVLVEAAPACNLVSDIDDKLPPEPTTDNVTPGFNEY